MQLVNKAVNFQMGEKHPDQENFSAEAGNALTTEISSANMEDIIHPSNVNDPSIWSDV